MKLEITAASLKSVAEKLAARFNELGLVSKTGAPVVVDHAYEGIAAMLGYRNQHVLRNALKQTLVMPASVSSAASAQSDDAERKAQKLEEFGYSFMPDSDQPGLWVWKKGHDGCSYSFDCFEDAVDDVWTQISGEIMEYRGMSQSVWGSMSLEHQLFEVTQAFRTGQALDALELEQGRCTSCQPASKVDVAQEAFEAFDFGTELVAESSGWEYSTGDNWISRTVYLENPEIPDAPSRRVSFNVEVVEGQAVNVSISN